MTMQKLNLHFLEKQLQNVLLFLMYNLFIKSMYKGMHGHMCTCALALSHFKSHLGLPNIYKDKVTHVQCPFVAGHILVPPTDMTSQPSSLLTLPQ